MLSKDLASFGFHKKNQPTRKTSLRRMIVPGMPGVVGEPDEGGPLEAVGEGKAEPPVRHQDRQFHCHQRPLSPKREP